MNKKIKLAAIHSKELPVPAEANPGYMKYDMEILRLHKEKSIEKMCAFLHEAGRQGVDLVCTHECFEGSGAGALDYERRDLFMSLVDEIPGPISERFSSLARKYNMNIAANYHEKEDGNIYNTSVLIDRKGQVTGKYRKVHVPPREKWSVTAGREFTVLQSDIGKIGFAVCYDLSFPEHCRAVALNGADIIIHQSMGWGFTSDRMGEALLRTRAADNCVYFLVAKNIQKINAEYGKSCIIDNHGDILAEAGGMAEKVVAAELEPDFDRIDKENYDTLFSDVECTRARKLLEREPLLYKVISDENPVLLEQYKGLELSSATPEKIRSVYEKAKKYEDDIANNRPVKQRYHW